MCVCVCVSVIRHILPVNRNVICFCDFNIHGQLKQLDCWEWKYFAMIFVGGLTGLCWEGLYERCMRCGVASECNPQETRDLQ
jgi:hypothetical protein